ncbi:hypothetical protein HanRHA438_Chr02g0095811 [Helianthus annuus]|nr:hypothetical protein HanRHA438_Chr02g0095811 [Helianthus annuus]
MYVLKISWLPKKEIVCYFLELFQRHNTWKKKTEAKTYKHTDSIKLVEQFP